MIGRIRRLDVLLGITFSLFTPNRIGDIGGRMLLFPRATQPSAFISSLVGSYCQLVVLYSTGIIGLLLYSLYMDFLPEESTQGSRPCTESPEARGATLPPHPGDDFVEQHGNKEHPFLIVEVRDAEDGNSRLS